MTAARVLNDGPFPAEESGGDVAARLRRHMNDIKGEFHDLDRGRVNYIALRTSEAYRRYAADAALLRRFDPRRLEAREEKLAFWVNLYNTLVIQGVIELGIRESVREEPHFFRAVAYRVGEMVFTPDDIEHGVLRGNRHPPHGILRPFSRSDPRLPLIVAPPDPRIHFALVCGSASCPPISFYTSEGIDGQLDLAAAGFVNGPGVEVLPGRNLLRLSPIFKWYSPDFGGREGVMNLLIRYRDSGAAKDFLIERGLGAEIEWQGYDWALNT